MFSQFFLKSTNLKDPDARSSGKIPLNSLYQFHKFWDHLLLSTAVNHYFQNYLPGGVLQKYFCKIHRETPVSEPLF